MNKLSLFFEKQNSQLSVLSLNIQSLNAKIDPLRMFIDELSQSTIFFPKFCIQETWLSDESDTSLLQLNNYTFVCKEKSCSEDGGLGFFIDNTLTYNILDISSISDLWECLFIEVYCPKHDLKLTLGNIYRQPRNLNEIFSPFFR